MILLNKTTATFAAVWLLLSATPFSWAESAKVYKWTDRNGKTHYSDKPFDDSSQEIKLKKEVPLEQQRKAKAAAQKMIQQQKRRLSNQLEEKNDLEQLKAKKEKESSEYQAACQDAKDGLKMLQMQRPVFVQKDNGEREFYDDERRKKEIIELEKVVSTHCSQ